MTSAFTMRPGDDGHAAIERLKADLGIHVRNKAIMRAVADHPDLRAEVAAQRERINELEMALRGVVETRQAQLDLAGRETEMHDAAYVALHGAPRSGWR